MATNVLTDEEDIEVFITSKELVGELDQNPKMAEDKESEKSVSTTKAKTMHQIYLEYMASKMGKKPNEKKHKRKKHKRKKHKKKKKSDIIPYYPLVGEVSPSFATQLKEEEYSIRQGHNIPSSMTFSSHYESFFMFGKAENRTAVGKDQSDDGHIAVFGGSGSGKTTGIAIPNLLTWKGTIFSFDFKGDLLRYAMKRRNTKILSFLENQQNIYWYDPFYTLRKDGEKNLIQNARELAYAIIPLPHNIEDPFWIMAARDILTGSIIYFFRLGKGFIDTMIEIKTTKLSELLKKLASDRMAAVCVNPDLDLNPKTLAGISMELHNHISVFATDILIQDVLSSSEDAHKEQISWEDLDISDIFIRLDQSNIEQWSSVIRLMLVQLVRTLQRRPEKYEPEGKKIPPTLLMLDEFPQYGKIDVITSALKVLRSKNVTISMFCQSLADLDETYGKVTRCSILDNCPYKAVLNAFDAETQRYFSDLIGTVKVPSKGITANFNKLGQPAGYSVSINESREPIIHPHEFASIQDVILLHPGPERFCRLEKEAYFRKNTYPELIEEGEK